MKLNPELKKRYGGSGPYTYGQVRTIIKDLRLSDKYADFACFVYCNQEEYKKYGFKLTEFENYRGYRDCYSGGD